MWPDIVTAITSTWIALCALGMIFMIAAIYMTQAEIPRHGGEAWMHGYDLTENPFIFDGDKAAIWADQWIASNRNNQRG